MPKLTPIEIKGILANEKADALSAQQAARLSEERSKALDYYMGDMTRDMPALPGRSKAVSSDVADTVEGLMPSLMEIFCGGDEVVRFDPVGPEDVAAAEQETDYVNHVFMQQNPGFLVLYSFIKDALLSKVGIVKVWWEETEEEDRQTYLDQSEDAYMMLIASPDLEVVEHSEHAAENEASGEPVHPPGSPLAAPAPSPGAPPASGPGPPPAGPPAVPMLHDVTVVRRKTCARAVVEAVPPEEFGISRSARSVGKADYCFHEVQRSEADLIAQGYDAHQVKGLPTYNILTGIEQQARDSVEERAGGAKDETNSASRLIIVTEHYIRLDMDDDGKPAIWRITTGGDVDGDILQRDGQDDIERVDVMPFAAMTPVIITHQFFGRSIADLVMDIQRIKTALLRAMLDNAYLANNPRTEVSESHVTENTLDDLLVSRPGGIVRTRAPGGLTPMLHTDISASVLPQLAYFDSTREWRTGVTRQGMGLNPDDLQNTTATAAGIMETAAQQKMKLIARIFAETGVRDMFALLHGTIRKHGQQAQTVRLRNQWVTVDPRDWKRRNDMTVNVGLGDGSKAQQIAGLTTIIGAQEKAVMGGLPIVSMKNFYNSAKALTRLLGFKDTDQFFLDPSAPPNPGDPTGAPIQRPPDPKMQADQAKADADMKHQMAKTQADQAMQAQKLQTDSQLAQQKFELDKQMKLLDAGLKEREHQMTMASHVVGMAGKIGAKNADGTPAGPDMETVKGLIGAMHPPMNGNRGMRARKLPDGSWVSEPA